MENEPPLAGNVIPIAGARGNPKKVLRAKLSCMCYWRN